MNDVFIKNQAASGTRLAPTPGLAGFVRRGVLACVLACTAAGAMAYEQDRGPRREEMQQSMRERYDVRAQDPRYDARAYEMQMREDAARRAQEDAVRERALREPVGRDEGRRGRMTPDERRDLRRQIDEAGMNLYPNARRR